MASNNASNLQNNQDLVSEPVSLQPKVKLTDIAYQKLEQAITMLVLEPGCSVSEQQLCELTEIGRTPVREAVQRLAREHLIIVLPQRGLFIPEINIRKQLKLLEARREVERLVCRMSAKRCTDQEQLAFVQLHQQFKESARLADVDQFLKADRMLNELTLKAARNEFAEGAMRLMHGLSRRFWYFYFKKSNDLETMALLHANVAEAIGQRDADRAAQASDKLLDYIEFYTKESVSDFM
jgi:DNA-binding GntR family transcriptional regulator